MNNLVLWFVELLCREILNKLVDVELVLVIENSYVYKFINRMIVNCYEGIVVIIINFGG